MTFAFEIKTAEDIAQEDLQAAKESALQELIEWINATTLSVTGEVPIDEKLAWSEKAAAARAVRDGVANEAQVNLIASEATMTGEDQSALISKIIANAENYTAIIGMITGLRRRIVAAIDAAETPEQVAQALGMAETAWAAVT